jgi:ubiquinone/menaquinone biosynthesis C-methylase UbiE
MSSPLKKYLLKLYYWPVNSPEKTNSLQKIIRDTEWAAVAPFIKKGKFLDVGCGAGYSLKLAQEAGNEVYGVDPDPGAHGVGRDGSGFVIKQVSVQQGFAEKLPFPDNMFDTVYSSHVLEHVKSTDESLSEMRRVLKPDGILILGMPTADMARVNFWSSLFFTSHFRFVNFFFSRFIKTAPVSFAELFVPRSHSYEGKSVFTDMRAYKVSVWQKQVAGFFHIHRVLLPAYYPFPEYKQWFRFRKNYRKSSSVFFICSKN